MGEFKGTKGNWAIDENDKFTVFSTDKTELNNIICVAPEGFESTKYWESNAKLIASAPEMLEMLIDLKDFMGSDKRSQIEDLIKKIN